MGARVEAVECMGDEELAVSFRRAKDKKAQISILADLNLCAPYEIAERLESMGELTGTGLMPENFPRRYISSNAKAGKVSKPGKRPPIDEIRAKELFDEGYDDLAIAEALGCSKTRIKEWRSRMHLLHPRGGLRTQKIDSERAMAMFRAGESDEAIAAAFGCSRTAVKAWRKRSGLQHPRDGDHKKREEAKKTESENQAIEQAQAETPDVTQAPDKPMRVWQFLADLKKILSSATLDGGLYIDGSPIRGIEEVTIANQDGQLSVYIKTEG